MGGRMSSGGSEVKELMDKVGVGGGYGSSDGGEDDFVG